MRTRKTDAQWQGSSLASLIAARVSAIDAEDPQRERKVFRAFLEANLLAEYGEQLVADPLFGTMVDAVHEQMEASEEIAGAMKEAVALLLAPSPPRT